MKQNRLVILAFLLSACVFSPQQGFSLSTPPPWIKPLIREKVMKNLKNGTSGMRDFAIHFTDMEVWINVTGVMNAFEEMSKSDGLIFTKETPILVGGDLRESTPHIMQAVFRAIYDHGSHPILNAGLVPTPVLALLAKERSCPCIMVTGSHIRGDMNGIKFYYVNREVLDDDVRTFLTPHIERVRETIYTQSAQDSSFTDEGAFKNEEPSLPIKNVYARAVKRYQQRFLDFFGIESFQYLESPNASPRPLRVLYLQHSTVARDIHPQIFRALRIDVDTEGVKLGRLNSFLAMDSENVTPALQKIFHEEAEGYFSRHGYYPDAVVTADGDGDRPFVMDEKGFFYRGDILNLLAVKVLNIQASITPISANIACSSVLKSMGIPYKKTKIGSPKVIKAGMKMADAFGFTNVYAWEVNGGGIQLTDIHVGEKKTLAALPTRDSLLPILCALHMMTKEKDGKAGGRRLSQVFQEEIEACSTIKTQAGLISFPTEETQKILLHFSPFSKMDKPPEEIRFLPEGSIEAVFNEDVSSNLSEWIQGSTVLYLPRSDIAQKAYFLKRTLERYWTHEQGFGSITAINWTDGIQLFFDNQTIAHLRGSGNAPEWRIYTQAPTQEQADALVNEALRSGGVYDRMAQDLVGKNIITQLTQ